MTFFLFSWIKFWGDPTFYFLETKYHALCFLTDHRSACHSHNNENEYCVCMQCIQSK